MRNEYRRKEVREGGRKGVREEGAERMMEGTREGRRERMVLQKMKETDRDKGNEIHGRHTDKGIIMSLSGE